MKIIKGQNYDEIKEIENKIHMKNKFDFLDDTLDETSIWYQNKFHHYNKYLFQRGDFRTVMKLLILIKDLHMMKDRMSYLMNRFPSIN